MRNAAIERLGLAPHPLKIVADLLQHYVPDRLVWAFGSRAFGRARQFSDSDLAVGGESTPPVALRYDLVDAFDDSMLPMEMDVVDLNDVDGSFRSRIEPDFVLSKQGGEAGQ